MKLVIVESPSKAKTIQKYLGKDFIVMASGGHVADLPEKSLGIDIDNNFQPEYVVNANKKELIRKLKKSVKESETVYLATDPDREGEAISWHLATNLGIDGQNNRIEFNEISSKAVKQAIEKPRPLNMQLVDAQQARRVLDRLVGYKVSPVLSRKIKSGLSGGRVQSAALKMVVDREREITAFIPEEYWHINAFLTQLGVKTPKIKALLSDFNNKKIKVSSKEQADKILSDLAGAGWSVDKVKRGKSKSRPSAPFMTSTLQQDAVQKLGLTAAQVMKIAQELYEGILLPGEGQTAFVTYIRTDSIRVAPDFQQETLAHIRDKYGAAYAPSKPNFYATKSQNTQDAHEAIRPISLDRTPENVKDKISRNHYRLYKLIYDRYIASQMKDAEYDTLNVRIQADIKDGGNYGFRLSGRTMTFDGYTIVYTIDRGEDEETSSSDLPNLLENEKLSLHDIKTEQKFTKPPARYTDSTLIKAMEENGIGRPSTYASVLSVLAKRDYTTREQKQIKPTNLGEIVTKFMEEYFNNIVDISFTADMEDKLDKIEHGQQWQKIIADFYPSFVKDLNKATTEDNKVTIPKEYSDETCEKCGATMIYKDGRYGRFLACPNYPSCRNVKSIVEPVGKCPSCGGAVVKRYSRAGRLFFGCGNYPKCNFMSWEIPAPILCPKCNSTMRIVDKDGNKQYICTNKTCQHTMTAPIEHDEKDTNAKS